VCCISASVTLVPAPGIKPELRYIFNSDSPLTSRYYHRRHHPPHHTLLLLLLLLVGSPSHRFFSGTTMTVPTSNSNRSSSAGMHTLVAGLTLSSSSPTTPAATQTSFAPAPTSIFNNPGHGVSSTSSSPRTSSSTPNRFAGRRLSYAVDASGRGNDSAVKEVDDPTSTPSADRSHIHTPSRTLAVASPQNTYGRCGSYRGPLSSFPAPPPTSWQKLMSAVRHRL